MACRRAGTSMPMRGSGAVTRVSSPGFYTETMPEGPTTPASPCCGRRMGESLVVVAIEHETDVVLARHRTRQLTELLGFDKQDQTRITTAVSEIARNAFEYC